MTTPARTNLSPDLPAETTDLLDLVAAAPPEEDARRLALPSGRVIEARAEAHGEDRVTIRSPSGMVELEVRMTERGPVLSFRSADLELTAARDVEVRCDTFHVRAKSGIVEETGGDLRQRVGGDAELKVRGKLTALAAEARVEAKRGGVQIEASDDVEIVGERVRLNC
jgi:hypothetical protein